MGSRTQDPAFQGGVRRAAKFGFQRVLMRNMVRFAYCVPRRPVLVYYSHPSSISQYSCLTAMRRECLPTRQTSHFIRITCELLQVVLCCPARSRRCRSYSKPRSSAPPLKAWRWPQRPREILDQCLRTLALGHEQHVPVRPCSVVTTV